MHTKIAGVATGAVRVKEGKRYRSAFSSCFRALYVPYPVLKSKETSMVGVQTVIGIKNIFTSVERKARSGNAVGKASGRFSCAGVVGKIGYVIGIAQHYVP